METGDNAIDESTARSSAQAVAEPALTIEERRERERHAKIAEAAYFLAMARNFEPGHEQEDWLAAEQSAGTDCAASAA